MLLFARFLAKQLSDFFRCFGSAQQPKYHNHPLIIETWRAAFLHIKLNINANKKGGVATSFILLCVPYLWKIYFCACFTITSCAPPSTIDVADTSVILPSSFSCLRFVTPQLHIVDFILPSVRSRLDLSEPAYGT